MTIREYLNELPFFPDGTYRTCIGTEITYASHYAKVFCNWFRYREPLSWARVVQASDPLDDEYPLTHSQFCLFSERFQHWYVTDYHSSLIGQGLTVPLVPYYAPLGWS